MDMEADLLTQPPPPAITPNLVLVIDDIEVNRILARAHLELLGWQVAECDSGQRALAFLRSRTPAAMLVDVRMPGISGDEVVRRVRAMLGPEILLVGYTAHCMPDDVRSIKAAGFDDVLVKPVSFRDMARIFSRKQGG